MSNDLVAQAGGGKRRQYFVGTPSGMYNAVCVDVIDLGYEVDEWQGQKKVKRKVQFAFQLDQTIDEKLIKKAKKRAGLPEKLDESDEELLGKPLLVFTKKLPLSLYETSGLRKFLNAWNGEDVGDREVIDGKDKTYVGRQATLMITEVADKNKKGVYYSNIVAITPPDEDAEPVVPSEDYVRRKDRDNYQAPPTEEEAMAKAGLLTVAAAAAAGADAGGSDDAIPFGDE